MKSYYYNNQLVRISENNNYKYGILKGSKIIACASRIDLAQKRLNEEYNYYQKHVIERNEKSLTKYAIGSDDYNELKEIIERQKEVLKTIRIVELEGKEED